MWGIIPAETDTVQQQTCHCSYEQFGMEINAAAKLELILILYAQGDGWGTLNVIRYAIKKCA